MPMNEDELRARDATRNIGAELLEAIRQVKAGHVGPTHVPGAPSGPGAPPARDVIDTDDAGSAAPPGRDPTG